MLAKVFSKSFKILGSNPSITLLFVIYLTIAFPILNAMATGGNPLLSLVLLLLSLLLTGAFLAGWFGVIKGSISNYERKDPLEDFKELKGNFFGSVSTYVLPIASILIFIMLFFIVVIALTGILFGQITTELSKVSDLPQNIDAITKFFMSLPATEQLVIAKKILFLYISVMVFNFLTIFWMPALIFNKENSTNPLKALLNSFSTVFKNFLPSILTFVAISIVNIALNMVQEYIPINNIVVAIMMLLKIYFISFVVVLVFALYEEFNCDNRNDSIGQNEPGDSISEEN